MAVLGALLVAAAGCDTFPMVDLSTRMEYVDSLFEGEI